MRRENCLKHSTHFDQIRKLFANYLKQFLRECQDNHDVADAIKRGDFIFSSDGSAPSFANNFNSQ